MDWDARRRPTRELSSSAQWRWLLVLLAITAAIVAAAGWRGAHQLETLQTLRAAAVEVERQGTSQTSSTDSTLPTSDLTSLLQRSPIPEPDMLRAIQRAAQSAQVDVISQTLTRQAPSSQQLGRHEIALNLRGSYPAIKTLLRELVLRWRGTTVNSIRLQRESAPSPQGNPGALDATVLLVFWVAPSSLTSSPPAAR